MSIKKYIYKQIYLWKNLFIDKLIGRSMRLYTNIFTDKSFYN